MWWDTSSMPMRHSPSKGSASAPRSAATRVMIAPTVRHATHISAVIADFEVRTASHAVCSSKSRVNPDPWRAHGTAATTTPCSAQRTRGASASTNARIVPRSIARHRRRPEPWS